MLTNSARATDNANVCSQSGDAGEPVLAPAAPTAAARGRIRELAHQHGVDAIRWWPPNEGDFLVEGLPMTLRQLRSDLQRTLGCKVAIYLADCLADDTRDRLRRETVDLLQ